MYEANALDYAAARYADLLREAEAERRVKSARRPRGLERLLVALGLL